MPSTVTPVSEGASGVKPTTTVELSSYQPLAYVEDSETTASGITLTNNNDGTVDVTIAAGTPSGRRAYMWWVHKDATGTVVDPSGAAVTSTRVRGEISDPVNLASSGVSIRFGQRADSVTGNGWCGGLHYDSTGILAQALTSFSASETKATSATPVGSETGWHAECETALSVAGVAANGRLRCRALTTPKEAMLSPAGANAAAVNDYNSRQEHLVFEIETENLIGGSAVTFTVALDVSCEVYGG